MGVSDRGPLLTRRTVEFLAVAAFAVGVYEIVVAGALALWPDTTDSWILLLWMTAATIAGLGMNWIRRLVGSVLRRVWPATAGPSDALVAMAAVGAVATTTAQACTDVASLVAAGTGAHEVQVWLAEPAGGLRAAGSWPVAPAGVAASSLAAFGESAVPVSDADGLLGALVLTARSGRAVTERDRRLAAEAADAVAPLLRNVRLTDELTRALEREQEQERGLARSRHRLVMARDVARARLSDEIQGRVGQVLAACAVDVDALIAADTDAEVLATMTERINGAITDFRQIVHGFYPAVLTDHGLEPCLENLVSELPWPATFQATTLPRFDQRVERGVYFCLAAIIGSLRDMPAGVNSLDLRVRVDDGVLSATLAASTDDHREVDFATDTIEAIEDRVGALDGELTVVREPTGLRHTLSVPIPNAGSGTNIGSRS